MQQTKAPERLPSPVRSVCDVALFLTKAARLPVLIAVAQDQNAPNKIAPTKANTAKTASMFSLKARSTGRAPPLLMWINISKGQARTEARNIVQCAK
jgi:hypothetical protein